MNGDFTLKVAIEPTPEVAGVVGIVSAERKVAVAAAFMENFMKKRDVLGETLALLMVEATNSHIALLKQKGLLLPAEELIAGVRFTIQQERKNHTIVDNEFLTWNEFQRGGDYVTSRVNQMRHRMYLGAVKRLAAAGIEMERELERLQPRERAN